MPMMPMMPRAPTVRRHAKMVYMLSRVVVDRVMLVHKDVMLLLALLSV